MSAVELSVRVAFPAILNRLEQNGHDGVFLLVKVPDRKGSPIDLLNVVEASIRRANAAMHRDGEEIVWATSVMASPKGPMINLDWIGSDEQTEEWLDTLAEALSEHGVTGTITAAPQAHLPEAMDMFTESPELTAYLGLKLTDPLAPLQDPARWLVEEAATRALCEHAVSWGAFDRATVYFGEDVTQIIVDDPDVSRDLERSIGRSFHARVTYLGKRPMRIRNVGLVREGQATYQDRYQGASWAELLDVLREPLLRDPSILDIAFVRRSAFSLGWWTDLSNLPYVDEGLVRSNRHLWRKLVPDAHGLQVLTREHLDQASDLSGWSVSSVGQDRFLVEARDLEPWYAGDEPDPGVLARARADFGAMILTPQAIEADPHGWVPGRPFSIRQEVAGS